MRQVKFRAWLEKDKEMMSWNCMNQNAFNYPEGKALLKQVFSDPNIIVMQYTGLKDKNGQEIYEGDLVKTYEEYEDEDTFDEKIHEVVWGGEDYPAFTLKPGLGTEMNVFSYLQLAADYNEVVEVIGNIYETPELLDND